MKAAISFSISCKGKPSPECNRIIYGRVLESLDHCFERSGSQTEMIIFAEEQLESMQKSVVKIAEKFLKHRSSEGCV